MYTIQIHNYVWMKSGKFGEYDTLEDTEQPITDLVKQSDADEWILDMDGSLTGYIHDNGNVLPAFRIQAVEK